uniref:Uncharacterized protein n=1 Tax=Glossina austeni TaxID=7395 RepID=A0A1A9UFV0_GLOAU
MMRFEKEQQQKEIRQEMKLRLARLQQQQHQQQHQQQLSQHKPQIIIGDTLMMQHGATLSRITMATPSPLTPNSMDELLPSVDETQEHSPSPETERPLCHAFCSNTFDVSFDEKLSSFSYVNQQSNTFIIQNYPPKTETKCTTETVVSATLTALKTAASSSPKRAAVKSRSIGNHKSSHTLQ